MIPNSDYVTHASCQASCHPRTIECRAPVRPKSNHQPSSARSHAGGGPVARTQQATRCLPGTRPTVPGFVRLRALKTKSSLTAASHPSVTPSRAASHRHQPAGWKHNSTPESEVNLVTLAPCQAPWHPRTIEYRAPARPKSNQRPTAREAPCPSPCTAKTHPLARTTPGRGAYTPEAAK